MTTAAMVVLGILAWILMAIPLALFMARMIRLNRPCAPAAELSLELSAGKPVLDVRAEAKPVLDVPVQAPVRDVSVEEIARFPAEPPRFVGRIETMAAAGTALTPSSGRTAVVFQGMAGVGKTTCAVELAYRHQRAFDVLVFWSAPTDPDQFGDALRLLAVALEAQLGDHGLAMAEEIATPERWENFLPTLTAVLTEASVFLVLDNLDTLLTADGQWRDLRWAPLIDALTGHQGPSRVILTSRIVPAGLNTATVLIQPVHALSREESVRLVRRLPQLHALLHTGALGRAVLTAAQGHPTLLELAAAAAADPPRLAYQLAEIEAAVDKAVPLAAFLTQGYTSLDAEQLLQIFTAWTVTVTATVPAPARLLLQALCRIEETDRDSVTLGGNWADLWRRLHQPGEPPPVAEALAPLVAAALVAADSTN
ncbi:MAG: NB-ARC domain-containing protein, partial [Micromonosporaceae bacterium]